jgi:Na+/H+ antiporter NhaC
MNRDDNAHQSKLEFHGGAFGALAPFAVFLGGVAWLGLSGAPDERGFWPVLLAGLAVGLLAARDRSAYAEAVLGGMSQRIVMLMVMAWFLAGVLGSLIGGSGFIEGLVALAERGGVAGGGFVAAAFLVCAVVSTATGTSLGTLVLCAPLIYPAGGLLGADPTFLIGAILAGATFGDNISPVSDTTIASASTQEADIGGVVRSRMKYALPAGLVSVLAFGALGGGGEGGAGGVLETGTVLRPLWMALAPALVIAMLLARRHLVESLMAGGVAAALLGTALGLIRPAELMSIDAESFIARGLILDGMERGVGISVFTILLMGLVGGLEASGLLDRVIAWARRGATTAGRAEWSIFGAVTAAVVLTTHSVVAILTVGRLARETGGAAGVSAYRRANILDITVCTYPFLLPFFIPTILAGALTASGEGFGVARVSALDAGLANVHSWALLAVILVAMATGYGRGEGSGAPTEAP